MNQIKQKIEEIGLSQREISKRLGKNDSYLAGVFRTGLSTAKQAELMGELEIVAGGGRRTRCRDKGTRGMRNSKKTTNRNAKILT